MPRRLPADKEGSYLACAFRSRSLLRRWRSSVRKREWTSELAFTRFDAFAARRRNVAQLGRGGVVRREEHPKNRRGRT